MHGVRSRPSLIRFVLHPRLYRSQQYACIEASVMGRQQGQGVCVPPVVPRRPSYPARARGNGNAATC
jgi:hypothetical protein